MTKERRDAIGNDPVVVKAVSDYMDFQEKVEMPIGVRIMLTALHSRAMDVALQATERHP